MFSVVSLMIRLIAMIQGALVPGFCDNGLLRNESTACLAEYSKSR